MKCIWFCFINSVSFLFLKVKYNKQKYTRRFCVNMGKRGAFLSTTIPSNGVHHLWYYVITKVPSKGIYKVSSSCCEWCWFTPRVFLAPSSSKTLTSRSPSMVISMSCSPFFAFSSPWSVEISYIQAFWYIFLCFCCDFCYLGPKTRWEGSCSGEEETGDAFILILWMLIIRIHFDLVFWVFFCVLVFGVL